MRVASSLLALAAAQAPAAPAPLVDRPVTRVINMLKDMQNQLADEQKKDEEIFNKLDCWCKVNKKEKEQAVGIAKQQVIDLTQAIQEFAGKKAQLEVEIKQLTKESAQNKDALEEATQLREKQAKAFYDENKDLIQSIEMLKNAVIVLGKHHNKDFHQIKSIVRHLLWRHGDRVPVAHQKVLTGLLQIPVTASYAPQSSEIFGILGSMKETMEGDLGDAKKTEDARIAAFADFKAAKESELKAAAESKANKKSELADSTDSLARSKEDLTNTREAQSADIQFLSDLNLKCQSTDHEFEERTKMRNEEIAAVTEAVAILSDDDAHDTFNRSVNSKPVALIQLSTAERQLRTSAAAQLDAAAKRTGSTELAFLAATVRLDAFTKIKKAIDNMVAQMKQEQADDVKHKDYCTKEFSQNGRDTTQKNREKEQLEIQIQDLKSRIEQLTAEIAEHNKEIAESQASIKEMGEDRAAQNAEFKQTVTDQQAAQAIISKALKRLEVVYAKKAALLAEPVPGAAAPPPPPSFQKYEKNSGSNAVLQMIKNIISDSEKLVEEATAAEQEAQANYEKELAALNDVVKTNEDAIIAKTDAKASADTEKTAAEQDLDAANTALATLSDYNANLHSQCDFLMKNFDIRQQARYDEMEAMNKAKAILSGADLDA